MTPIEFITKAHQTGMGVNTEEVNEALEMHLTIRSHSNEWEVLSYYYAPETGEMVLDIQKRGGKKRRKT